MKKKFSSIFDLSVDMRHMIEGGCWGMLVGLPFFFMFIIIFGVGDRALDFARNFIAFGGPVGGFLATFKSLAKRGQLIIACVLSSTVIFLISVIIFVQN